MLDFNAHTFKPRMCSFRNETSCDAAYTEISDWNENVYLEIKLNWMPLAPNVKECFTDSDQAKCGEFLFY